MVDVQAAWADDVAVVKRAREARSLLGWDDGFTASKERAVVADEPKKMPIQNKCAQQYAEDLTANRKEQSEITAQVAALHE